MSTAYLYDERCLWHNPGQFALLAPVGGFVQPGAEHPDNPETKRRLHNLLQVSGLHQQLDKPELNLVSDEDLLRVHSKEYLSRLAEMSAGVGGDAGEGAPFGVGGFEQAKVATSLVKTAIYSVMEGRSRNAYALSRPAGHHAERDRGRGFCLLANIPVAIESARAAFGIERVAILDWDVHHGNGQEGIYYEDPNTLTISLHQELIYPEGRGLAGHRGSGKGLGASVNIPLLAGSGGGAYRDALERIVLPQLERFNPQLVVVACGFDASIYDPLGRCMLSSEDYRTMTSRLLRFCDQHCNGRLVCAHEGGYSAAYVPFCGLAVMEELSGVRTEVVDEMLALDIELQPAYALREWQRQQNDQTLAVHADPKRWVTGAVC